MHNSPGVADVEISTYFWQIRIIHQVCWYGISFISPAVIMWCRRNWMKELGQLKRWCFSGWDWLCNDSAHWCSTVAQSSTENQREEAAEDEERESLWVAAPRVLG